MADPQTTMAQAQWVREWWADRMRAQSAPDLPNHISIEVFERVSERLADQISPRGAESHG